MSNNLYALKSGLKSQQVVKVMSKESSYLKAEKISAEQAKKIRELQLRNR